MLTGCVALGRPWLSSCACGLGMSAWQLLHLPRFIPLSSTTWRQAGHKTDIGVSVSITKKKMLRHGSLPWLGMRMMLWRCCCNDPLFGYSVTLLLRLCGSLALRLSRSQALRHCGSVALRFRGTAVPWHCGSVALRFRGTAVPWLCVSVALWS